MATCLSLEFHFMHQDIGPVLGIFGWMLPLFKIAVITALAGGAASVIGLTLGQRRLGWLGLAASLSPLPLGWAVFSAVIYWDDLRIS